VKSITKDSAKIYFGITATWKQI